MDSFRPLVSLPILTYNQEQYVQDAIRGALAQTYAPLEIIISDDCSTDCTWRLILEEVDRYKKSGGCRHKIVLNRNSENMGLIGNFNKVISMCRGELIVGGAGDDISLPKRVEKIVDAWTRSNYRAMVFHSGYREIDLMGRVRSVRRPRSAAWALGATMVLAKKVYDSFPALSEKIAAEDQVWAKRAWLLGDEVQIDEPLVDYRVGGGISTGFKSIRECWRKNGENMLKSLEILDRDVEAMKDSVPSENLARVKAAMDRNRRWATLTYDAVMAKSFKRRVHCLVALMGWSRFLMKGWLYLLPYFPRIKC